MCNHVFFLLFVSVPCSFESDAATHRTRHTERVTSSERMHLEILDFCGSNPPLNTRPLISFFSRCVCSRSLPVSSSTERGRGRERKRGSWNGKKKRKCILGVCYNFRAYGRPGDCVPRDVHACHSGGGSTWFDGYAIVSGEHLWIEISFGLPLLSISRLRNEWAFFCFFSSDFFVSCRFSSGTEDRGIESGFFVPLE